MLKKEEFREHLQNCIIPFWISMRDDEFGGYYGYMDYDLSVDKKAVKGVILNSRILWFFSNAYAYFKDEKLLKEAEHAYDFMTKYCIDKENGGVFWSVKYDGTPFETLKHTYNQAFAIYALSSFYDATGRKNKEVLDQAYGLFDIIESKCLDENGYLEALDEKFNITDNDKLSENGVMADRTMNTALHVFEAYTELYRVTGDTRVKDRLLYLIDTFAEKIYNPKLHRQEVFFNNDWEPIIDLHSYGHDIETAWLVDRGVEILGDEAIKARIYPITSDLTENIYNVAFDGHSLANECENGVVNDHRIWWVQAETVLGFLNGYLKDGIDDGLKAKYMEAAENTWEYIKANVVDKREGSEWFWEVRPDGTPFEGRPIVEPWKCPYHNGRMCIEVLKRL